MQTFTYVESYDSKEFGLSLQNLNSDKIVSISWEEGDEHDSYSPKFFFFKSLEELLIYLNKIFSTPFVLASFDDPVFTKKNAVLVFNDADLNVKIITYKYNGTIFQFYRTNIYRAIKQTLSQNTIQWSIYASE